MKNTQDITLYNSFTPEKCRNIPYPAPPIMSIIHMLPKNDGNKRLYFFSYIISAQNRVVIIENREVTTSDARSVCVSIVTRSSRLCLEAPAKSAINIEASNSKNPRISDTGMVNTDTIRSDSSPCKKSSSSDSVTIASPGTTWPRTAPISCPASAVQLFSGMVFCGECGASMVRKTVPSGNKKYVYYVCAAHKQDKSCSPHRMRDEALEQLVLDTVKQYIRDVVDLDDILAMTDTAPLRTAEAQKVQRQLDKKRSEYERLQKLLMSLYESLADGIIDRDEYARLKQNYAGRCAECEKQMDALQETLTQIREHGGEHREWMAQFRKHLNIAELERSIVVALIDRILIYRDNRVEVRFRFADEFAWQTDILRRSQIREVV